LPTLATPRPSYYYHNNNNNNNNYHYYRMISGLALDSSLSNLCLVYLATIQALAYGTRHIIEALEEKGHRPITSIFICGQ